MIACDGPMVMMMMGPKVFLRPWKAALVIVMEARMNNGVVDNSGYI